MRVLLVTHRYPPDGVGGVERYVERLRGALVDAGDTAVVLTRTPRHFPRRPRLVGENGVYRIVGSGVRLREFLVGHAAVERAFSSVLAEFRPEIVHINHLIGLSPRIVALASRAGARVVLSLHDFFIECPLVHLVKTSGELCAGPNGGEECAATCFAGEGAAAPRWSVRYAYFAELLRTVDRVVASSQALADGAVAMTSDVRVEVLPLGIERNGRAVPPGTMAPLTLAHLGTPSRHKGVFQVVDALEAAKLPSVRLCVHGRLDDANARRDLERAAAAVQGLELVVAGEYPPGALPSLLDGAHAVVAVSQVPEGYPLAPREALVAGVPVVASAIGGMAEVVRDGVDGFLVAPRDTAALAAVFTRLAEEPALHERLRAGARTANVPTLGQHTEALRTLYATLLSNGGGRTLGGLEVAHTRALEVWLRQATLVTPRASVVMTVHDGEAYLSASIESVLAQSLSDLELVVVDDASTDATPTILRSFAENDDRIVVERRQSPGRIEALNLACRLARSAYIAILDADDEALPERLRVQVDHLDLHPEIALVGGAAVLVDNTGSRLGVATYPQEPDVIGRRLLETNCIIHSAATFRRSAYEEVGGYRGEALHAEDYDLWLRIADSRPLANLRQPVVRYRVHLGSDTSLWLEQQATAAAAASVSARVRRSTGVDPVRRGERMDGRFLRRIGVEPGVAAYRTAMAASAWAGTMLDAGCDAEVAAVLDHLGERLPRTARGPVYFVRARQAFRRGRVWQGALDLGRAMLADPRRSLSLLLRKRSRWAAGKRLSE